MGREAEACLKERAREWVGSTDLVGGVEAVKAMPAAARDEVDALKDKIVELEARAK